MKERGFLSFEHADGDEDIYQKEEQRHHADDACYADNKAVIVTAAFLILFGEIKYYYNSGDKCEQTLDKSHI